MDLWDLYQHGEIAAARARAGDAHDTALGAHERVLRESRRLEAKIDGLALLSQALWELVREHTTLSEADLRAKVAEIDARDGRIDGRITGTSTNCVSCERPTHSRQSACMYCGTPIERQNAFER